MNNSKLPKATHWVYVDGAEVNQAYNKMVETVYQRVDGVTIIADVEVMQVRSDSQLLMYADRGSFHGEHRWGSGEIVDVTPETIHIREYTSTETRVTDCGPVIVKTESRFGVTQQASEALEPYIKACTGEANTRAAQAERDASLTAMRLNGLGRGRSVWWWLGFWKGRRR